MDFKLKLKRLADEAKQRLFELGVASTRCWITVGKLCLAAIEEAGREGVKPAKCYKLFAALTNRTPDEIRRCVKAACLAGIGHLSEVIEAAPVSYVRQLFALMEKDPDNPGAFRIKPDHIEDVNYLAKKMDDLTLEEFTDAVRSARGGPVKVKRTAQGCPQAQLAALRRQQDPGAAFVRFGAELEREEIQQIVDGFAEADADGVRLLRELIDGFIEDRTRESA